jgi:hypothetical protein
MRAPIIRVPPSDAGGENHGCAAPSRRRSTIALGKPGIVSAPAVPAAARPIPADAQWLDAADRTQQPPLSSQEDDTL